MDEHQQTEQFQLLRDIQRKEVTTVLSAILSIQGDRPEFFESQYWLSIRSNGNFFIDVDI